MKKYSKVKIASSKSKSRYWATKVLVLSISLSLAFGFLSQSLLSHVGAIIASVTIALFIFIGVIFDMVGIAVAGADEDEFAKWANAGVLGAKMGLRLCQNSEKVCSFCADVVGDICSTLCGAAGACIVATLTTSTHDSLAMFISVSVSALIAGFTIFFKALMKSRALDSSNKIILSLGKLLEKTLYKEKNLSKTVDKQ